MPDLPPIPDEVFDGEKYTTTVEFKPCQHDVEMVGDELRCKKCKAGWRGSQVQRLYEEFKRQKSN